MRLPAASYVPEVTRLVARLTADCAVGVAMCSVSSDAEIQRLPKWSYPYLRHQVAPAGQVEPVIAAFSEAIAMRFVPS